MTHLPCPPAGTEPRCGRWPRRCSTALLALLALAGCGSLLPSAPEPPARFALDQPASGVTSQLPGAPIAAQASTLVVGLPRAAAGFDSSRMVYIRQAHQLEYFAYNQWVDPPAQMLWPLITRAVESTAAFKAVVVSPSGATADWRLDVELLRLQQEFTAVPSRVRVTLRAHLIDSGRRSVVASREIDAVEPAATDDPYGGVVAANRAVARAVGELAMFAAASAAGHSTARMADPAPTGVVPAGVPTLGPAVRSTGRPAASAGRADRSPSAPR